MCMWRDVVWCDVIQRVGWVWGSGFQASTIPRMVRENKYIEHPESGNRLFAKKVDDPKGTRQELGHTEPGGSKDQTLSYFGLFWIILDYFGSVELWDGVDVHQRKGILMYFIFDPVHPTCWLWPPRVQLFILISIFPIKKPCDNPFCDEPMSTLIFWLGWLCSLESLTTAYPRQWKLKKAEKGVILENELSQRSWGDGIFRLGRSCAPISKASNPLPRLWNTQSKHV